MITVTLLQTCPAADFVTLCRFLSTWLRHPDLASIELADEVFDALPRIAAAIPPTVADLGLMCYLRNRVRSSRELVDAGDFATAAYQLREMGRKLDARRDD